MAYGTADEDDFFTQIRFEYTLMAEYAQLQRHSIPGVYVLPSGQTSHLWYGLIFITSGIYQGAVYKFTLTVSKGYPDDGCPEFDFQAGVFHPVVHYETGELDVRREFPTWRRGVDFLYHLLQYAQGIFHNVETTDPLNSEAAKLYDNNRDEFQARVKQSIERCRQEVLNSNSDDPHSIKFAEWNADVIKAASSIFESENDDRIHEEPLNAQVSGLSWVKKGTTEPFRVPCHYSVWGEYVITPLHDQNDLLIDSDPLMVKGTNPSHQKCNAVQHAEERGEFKEKVVQSDKQKCCKSTTSATRSVKYEAIRESVESSSNTLTLKINQTLVNHGEDESLKMKAIQDNTCSSSKMLNSKPERKDKVVYKHMHSFQPCNTCKQIVEHRKRFFVAFKSTLHEDDSGVEFENIAKATVTIPWNSQEDVTAASAYLPVMKSNSGSYHKEKQSCKVSFKPCNSYFAKYRSKSAIEKSDLVRSKERIEELLRERRKPLCCFMDDVGLTAPPVPHNFSCSGHIGSSLISPPHVPESLAGESTNDNKPETTVHSPTAHPYNQSPMVVKNRRCGININDDLIPIPNENNSMRILQKSLPNKKGFVSWHKLASIKLRGYQVEIIRTFIHHLGISYWRLRYLVPKAASILSHTSWVQINSLYFDVMITPHNKAINMNIFTTITSAEVTNNEIVTSKDPDMLMDQLTPIPNAFSSLPAK